MIGSRKFRQTWMRRDRKARRGEGYKELRCADCKRRYFTRDETRMGPCVCRKPRIPTPAPLVVPTVPDHPELT